MQLVSLKLSNFRNYRQAEIEFNKGIHVLFGDNGAGKTSILEAIYYLALTKSFRTSIEKNLVHNQENILRVEGDFLTSSEQSFRAAIAYSMNDGKHLSIGGQKPEKFSDYIGEVPLVLLHPADLSISQGGPQLRRRFLDVLLSQSSKLYLHHLIQYNRSLKQRNQLLQNPNTQAELLYSWEQNLIEHGVEIIRKREHTAQVLGEAVAHYYQALSNREDAVTISYESTIQPIENVSLEDHYAAMFEAKREREIESGVTMIGPHRDDLIFKINNQTLKVYASQGEHKTFVISLKLAEFLYLQRERQQAPILLFDDIFGELDAGRIEQMLTQLSDIGQVFVTTTSRTFFDKVHQVDSPVHYYAVGNGQAEACA